MEIGELNSLREDGFVRIGEFRSDPTERGLKRGNGRPECRERELSVLERRQLAEKERMIGENMRA